MSDATKTVICLVRDLLFFSKIRGAAGATGVTLKNFRDPAKLADEPGEGLLVDLSQPDCLQSAAAWRLRTGKPVVGFASHVDVETINAAKAAGIDRVLTRGQFDRDLPAILVSLTSE